MEMQDRCSDKFESEEFQFEGLHRKVFHSRARSENQLEVTPTPELPAEGAAPPEVTPSELMQSRWIQKVFKSTPSMDIKDMLKPRGTETQFDAQYTQSAYLAML